MHVKLISVTKPAMSVPMGLQVGPDDGETYEMERDMTAEELLIYIARVSNPENQGNHATAPKLIRYLIDHKHWSPFDMANLCVEVKTSKAIGIQILRHWSIKPQEFSQRYGQVTEIEPIELRRKAGSNRQGSDGESFNPLLDYPTGLLGPRVNASTRGYADEIVQNYINEGVELYKHLIEAGVANECARFVLPLATSTTMYLNGSIRSWIHYLEQRLSPHAQKEHKEVAQQIEVIFKQQFPNVAEALGL